MKQYYTKVKNKQELTTDLMCEEIIQLRKEAAGLMTHLWNLYEAVEEEDNVSHHTKKQAEKAKHFHQSLKNYYEREEI